MDAEGNTVVSASNSSGWQPGRQTTLKVWDLINGIERLTLIGHTKAVTGCIFNPDGRLIVSASMDGTLKLWSSSSGACLTTLRVDGPLSNCAWTKDKDYFVALGTRGVYFLRIIE